MSRLSYVIYLIIDVLKAELTSKAPLFLSLFLTSGPTISAITIFVKSPGMKGITPAANAALKQIEHLLSW
jgi:hypothetical protein